MTDWWAEYFDETFLRIYRALLGPERTAAEVAAIVELLDLEEGSDVLDVACGWGRHAVELADRGYAVTGVDFSPLLLGEAARVASETGVELTLHQADMREMEFDARFDGAVSLFSSLGYFGSDAEDARVLAGVRRALRPGGRFVLDTMHRDLIARDFVERDWWPTPEGDHVWVEREFDPIDGVSLEVLRWREAGGREGEKTHSIRIRTATEWKALLTAAGLHAEEWFGSWDLEPLSHASPRLIVLCRRP
jgi:cyclopropane fatty-acyl-phospholipid synthase-like methyltransferase